MKAAEEMTPEQFEQAKANFRLKYGMRTLPSNDMFDSDLTALLEQHKEMILREELIKFGDYFNECVSKTIYTSLIDEYLKSRER